MKPTYNKQGKHLNLFTERPYFSKNIIELREVVAKQFAKPKTDKKILKLVLEEMKFRTGVSSKFLKGMLKTYFKSLPK